MNFGKQCSVKLQELVGGHKRFEDLYFTLVEIKKLPKILQSFKDVEGLIITPYHITDNSIMEVYWCELIIEIVDNVQDKFIELLSEAGKTNLEEIETEYIEQWDYTHYPILKDDKKGIIESLERYISYMESREIALREEYDIPNHNEQGIFYSVW
ncbi:hypothetical protein [Peribacillus huizhouensis]|uniref:Uncharacterized protein n=1 Tax=Peribacillus huizhouensis TaxID=1501239 RepID=A0ABR6CJR6_9BACI|nr:hypothetical protein [Peribacillus huizhouensis]MBA9025297.1 hypothetical protein [Peribacillus huizhouensis]